MIDLVEFLKSQIQIVRLLKGKACTMQAEGSDVKLHTEDGIWGILLEKVHTNYSRFLHHIPDAECVVGPICEYSLHPFKSGTEAPQHGGFTIQVPHIVKDIVARKERIKVRKICLEAGVELVNYLPLCLNNQKKNTFNVDQQYINIFPRSFCRFLVTAEGLNCCAQSAQLLLFGKLKNMKDYEPLVTVNTYFASNLYEIQDNLKVGINMCVYMSL